MLDIVGASELAKMLGVPRGQIYVWKNRGKLPEPDVVLAAGPVWRRSTIERWMKQQNRGGDSES